MRVGLTIQLIVINLAFLLAGCLAKEPHSPTKSVKAQERTFISEIIGFSALKFLLLLTIPLVFSIFLGTMIVFLFPFPLVTTTQGLAGAAAIGKRQGKSVDSEMDDYKELLEYLGVTPQPIIVTGNSKVKHYNPYKNIKHYVYNNKPVKSALKQSRGKYYNEKCSERIACEIGRSAGLEIRTIINQAINELSVKDQQKWKGAIHAYFQGSQSQESIPVTSSSSPLNHKIYHYHPHQQIQVVQEEAYRGQNKNLCPKYKCQL